MENSRRVLIPVAEKMKLSRDEAARPDISFGVGLLEELKESHWIIAKRILRYVKRTSNDGIFYSTNEAVKLVGYRE